MGELVLGVIDWRRNIEIYARRSLIGASSGSNFSVGGGNCWARGEAKEDKLTKSRRTTFNDISVTP